MKKCLLIWILFLLPSPASADQYVHGYYRNNGTYVQPYHRSTPDSTVTNNYSYEGNINPYTGSVGSHKYEHDATSPYFDGTPDNNGRIGHSEDLGTNQIQVAPSYEEESEVSETDDQAVSAGDE